MAEVFGIVSGAVGIASAFSTCIEIFNYVSLGQRFGKDYETCQLRLQLVQLRLSRWGEAVCIYEDPKLGRETATEEELNAAKETLFHILKLFEDSNIVSKKFRLDASQIGDANSKPTSQSREGFASMVLRSKVQNLTTRRQKSASFRKLMRWAVHDREVLNRLVEDIVNLVNEVEALFPLPTAIESRLVSEEISELRGEEGAEEEAGVQGEEESRTLMQASEGIDDVLYKATASNIVGHQYTGVHVLGANAAVMNGNIFAGDSRVSVQAGSSHIYDGVKITGAGVKVLNGDQFGGKGFF